MPSKLLDRYRPHKRVQLDPGVGRTKQSFAPESNINLIIARYEKTGIADHLNHHQGNYGDFIAADDYHTSINRVREAEASFMTIPAGVRSKFDNDPAKFLAFVQDPENFDEMVTMGLATARSEDPAAAPNVELKAPGREKPAAPSEDPSEPPKDDA